MSTDREGDSAEGLIASLPGVAAAKPGYRIVIEAKVKRFASEDRVNVGETYKENFTARCYDSDGNEVDDAVYWSVTGEPTSGDAKAQWIPEVGRTFVPSVLKISTSTKTKAGVYPLSVVVHGEICGTSAPIEYPLEVAPVLSGDTTIWWFDGANPSNYKTKGTLKALPADQGSRIGSTSVGQGRKVQSNVWQRYQDHAAHEFVVSPVQ